jgi:hypothetical protein
VRRAAVLLLLLQGLQGSGHEVLSGGILAAGQRVINELGDICG